MRHFSFEGGSAVFDVVPAPSDDQLDETLHLACVALIGAAVAVNEMCGFTEVGKRLPEINGKLKALQAENFGEKTIGSGESLEIKVGP